MKQPETSFSERLEIRHLLPTCSVQYVIVMTLSICKSYNLLFVRLTQREEYNMFRRNTTDESSTRL